MRTQNEKEKNQNCPLFTHSKLKSKGFGFLLYFFVLCFMFWVLDFANAAVLYLEPAEGEYHQGDTFLVDVRIDSEGECLNTVEAYLNFPTGLLEVEDISRGNSVIPLWLKEPDFSNQEGKVSFMGAMPGGYCGIIPGDPGKSNLLGKIIFKVKKVGEQFSNTAIMKFLDSSQVLLNDGLGTPAKLISRGAVIKITGAAPLQVSKDEWQAELEKDSVPPEEFAVLLSKDPSVFEGKYFITFSTVDKQTGVDFYRVKEGKRDWKKAQSPYLLEDQSLSNIIKVGAVDKAGNERIVEYAPPVKSKPFPFWTIILIVPGIIIWLWWKYIKKKRE